MQNLKRDISLINFDVINRDQVWGKNPQNIHSAYIIMFSFSECYTRQLYTMFDWLEQSIMGGDEELSQDHSMAWRTWRGYRGNRR